MPPLKPGCGNDKERQLDVIYPEHGTVISLPRNFDGKRESVIMQAAHTRPDAVIYWYIDDEFVGTTSSDHRLALKPDSGSHRLTLTDTWGNRKVVMFEVK